MTKKHFLGLDLGTSSVKALLLELDENKHPRIAGVASSSYPLLAPSAEAAEQNPEEWWSATIDATNEVIKKSGIEPSSVAGISLSGQMHGLVSLDKNYKPVRPAIIWADNRPVSEAAWLEQQLGTFWVRSHCGSASHPSFTAAKLEWLQRNEPNSFQVSHLFLLPKDYLAFRLCGFQDNQHATTDFSDASASFLFDIQTRHWSPEVLEVLHLSESRLPNPVSSDTQIGTLCEEAARQFHLPGGIPIIAGAGDTEAAAVGSGILDENDPILLTIGSAAQVFAPLNAPMCDNLGRVHTFCHAAENQWHLLGAILSAGLARQWFADGFYSDDPANTESPIDRMTKEAASIEAGSEGLLFLPYLLGERTPHFNPNLRGVFSGLNLHHTRKHMARAVLEGIAFALRDAFEVVRSVLPNEGIGRTVCLTGGGARDTMWPKIIASVLGTTLHLSPATDSSALGAAFLAAKGVQAISWEEIPALSQELNSQPRSAIEPDQEWQEVYDKIYLEYKSLGTSAIAMLAEKSFETSLDTQAQGSIGQKKPVNTRA